MDGSDVRPLTLPTLRWNCPWVMSAKRSPAPWLSRSSASCRNVLVLSWYNGIRTRRSLSEAVGKIAVRVYDADTNIDRKQSAPMTRPPLAKIYALYCAP